MRTLHLFIGTAVLALTLGAGAGRQTLDGEGYMRVAAVSRKGGRVTVSANDPRPLAQALCGVQKQYNWLVDYEDPPYEHASELRDAADPKWRAAHPDSRVGIIPRGGAFRFEYEEGPALETGSGQEAVLRRLVEAYNRIGNPGKFTLLAEGEDPRPWSKTHRRFSIVGASVKGLDGREKRVVPILDTPISVPVEERNVSETLNVILGELTKQTGVKVSPPGWGINLLIQSKVTVGGDNLPARELLLRTLRGMSNPSLVWALLYDPTGRGYFLNLGVVHGRCN